MRRSALSINKREHDALFDDDVALDCVHEDAPNVIYVGSFSLINQVAGYLLDPTIEFDSEDTKIEYRNLVHSWLVGLL